MPIKILTYRGKSMELAGPVVLGRHRQNQIRIDDGAASRQHARVELRGDEAWVVDLGSANGTRVNGIRVEGAQRLRRGDRIQIGQSEVVFGLAEVREGGGISRVEDATETAAAVPREAGRATATESSITRIDRLDDLIGRTLAGHRINRMLVQDAFSALFVARQENLGRTVALRVFRREVLDRTEGVADMALDLARRAGRLSHRHLGKVHECGSTDGLVWNTMEFISGRNLGQIIAEDGPLDPEPALLVLEETARALAVAHAEGIVHGDIRPESIIIDEGGTTRLTNFGTAPVQCAMQSAQGKAACVGSPLYCAPEFADTACLDFKTDIYSLGCTLYTALTGEPPFMGATPQLILARHRKDPIPNPADRRPELPQEFNKLLHGMLDKNVAWRYGTVRELLDEIEAVKPAIVGAKAAPAPRKVHTPAPAPGPRARSNRQRVATRPTDLQSLPTSHKNLVVLAVVAVLLLILLIMFPFLKGALMGGRNGANGSRHVTHPQPGGTGGTGEDEGGGKEWARHGPRLGFDDPVDLDALECTLGEPALVDSRLTGANEDPVVLRCTHPFGGPDWTVRFTVRCPAREGQVRGFALDITENSTPLVLMSIEEDNLTSRIRRADGTEETNVVRLSADDLAMLPVAIRCREGRVSISLAGEVHVPDTTARPVRAARVGINGNGTTWQLDELEIYGQVPPQESGTP